MVYELNNGCLSLAVDSRGAQLLRLDSAEGHPFLWEGDEKYWPDHSPLLFPFVGRLTKDSYRLGEQTYSMSIHGFAAAQTFRLVRQEQDRLVLELESSPETLASYPFRFSLEVEYQLCQNTLSIRYTVRNRDSRVMPFGIGGHPGFRLPMEPGREFSDYWLEFESPCLPARVLTTPPGVSVGAGGGFSPGAGPHSAAAPPAVRRRRHHPEKYGPGRHSAGGKWSVHHFALPRYAVSEHLAHHRQRCAFCLHRALDLSAQPPGRGGGSVVQK